MTTTVLRRSAPRHAITRAGVALAIGLGAHVALASGGDTRIEVWADGAAAHETHIADSLMAAKVPGVVLSRAVLPPPKVPGVAGFAAYRAVRAGQVGVAIVPLAALQRLSSLYAVDAIPFLAPNREAGLRLLAVARPFIEKRLAEDGVILLAAGLGAPFHLALEGAANDAAERLSAYEIAAQTAAERRFAELTGIAAATAPKSPRPRARFTDEPGPGRVTAHFPIVVVIARQTGVDTTALVAAAEAAVANGAATVAGTTLRDQHAAKVTAAAERMADEWAIATGADGVAILGRWRADAK